LQHLRRVGHRAVRQRRDVRAPRGAARALPESRSDAKGTEPEGIAYAAYGDEHLLFVGTERAGFVAVYALDGDGKPHFRQLLPPASGRKAVACPAARPVSRRRPAGHARHERLDHRQARRPRGDRRQPGLRGHRQRRRRRLDRRDALVRLGDFWDVYFG
ncbi:MAG TPA: hypothetical protein VF183_13130, partial [Acidimicrobiales bacterium]